MAFPAAMLPLVTPPLRLMIFDQSCRNDFPRPKWLSGLPWLGMSHSWQAGARLYTMLDRLDAWRGFDNWSTALGWLARFGGSTPIAEIQFWGHGKWGCAKISGESLDRGSLAANSVHRRDLEAIRERMSASGKLRPLWWFRTCETFGAKRGQDFAQAWTDFFGSRAAGHTYIIGPLQSGLHSLEAGQRPTWSASEGIAEGTASQPRRAQWSRLREPNTITCFRGTIPLGY